MRTAVTVESGKANGVLEIVGSSSSAQILKNGEMVKVTAKAGEKYRIIKKNGTSEVLADDVIATKVGDSLHLQYGDGTQISLEGFYSVEGCEITLPASDGGVHAVSSQDVLSANGSNFVYAHGDHNTLMSMTQSDHALQMAVAQHANLATLPHYAQVATVVATDASAGASAGGATAAATTGAATGMSTAAMIGLGALGVGAVAVAASSGGGGGDSAPATAPTDTTAPVLASVLAHGVSKTVVLTYGEALDASHPPLISSFTITTGGVANVVTAVAVSGTTVTLTLTNAFGSGDAVVISYNGSGVSAIQDASGNDAVAIASLSSGAVADGYVRGAQIWIDTNRDGVQDYNTGITTDESGNFFLPPGTPSGSIVAIGGVNIDTGVPNTMPLRAPEGSTVINPLTTLVQAIIQANPSTSVATASSSVVTALGLTAGTNLTTYDPIEAAQSSDSTVATNALAAQKAAATVATVIALATATQSATDATTTTNTIVNNIVTQIQTATTPLDLGDSTTVSNLTAGVTLAPEVQSAIADTSTSIKTATDVNQITTAQSVALDTIAVGALTITATAVTADTTPAIKINLNVTSTNGTAAVTGDTVLLKADGIQIATAALTETDIARGYITLNSPALSEGVHAISAVIVDQAGNISAPYPSVSVTVDTAPTTPSTINRVATDDIINASEKIAGVTLGGTIASGSTVTVDGNVATVNGTSWSYTLSASDYTAMGEGAETIDVVVTAANSTTASSTREITIDTIAPLAPVINTISGDNAINASDKAGVTTISGTAEAYALITLTLGAGNSHAVTANGSGVWTYTLTTADYTSIGTGATITATAKDSAGNVSPAVSQAITVDTGAPLLVANSVAIDNIINATEKAAGVTVTGTTEAGAAVTVNGASATVTGTTWSYVLDATAIGTMGEGSETLTIVTTDAAGNARTRTKTINVDTTAPAFTSGTTATISENTTTVIYTASATGAASYSLGGADAALFNLDSVSGAVTFKVAPDFENPTDAGANNTYDITLTATDAAGNVSSPQAVVLTVQNVDVTVNTIAMDDIINAAEKAIGVTITGNNEPGISVVTVNGQNATVNGTSWSHTLDAAAITAMGEGTETLTIVSGGATITKNITVDTAAPTITISAITADDILNSAEVAVGGAISGTTTAEDGRTVTVKVDGVILGTATVTGGTWSLPVSAQTLGTLTKGSHTIAADVSDAAGNPAVQATHIFAVDTVAPTGTINDIAGDNIINATENAILTRNASGTSTAENGSTVVVKTGTTVLGSTTVQNGIWNLDFTVANQTPDGNYVRNVDITDLAGNVVTLSKNFTVDTVAATLGYTLSNGTATISNLESGASWEYQIDGGSFTTGTGNTFTVPTSGTHTFAIRQTDVVGNISTLFSGTSVDGGNTPSNSNPYTMINNNALFIVKGIPLNINLQNYVGDPDGDTVAVTVNSSTLPAGLTIANGVITGTTTATTGTLNITLNDGHGGTSTQTIALSAIDDPSAMAYVYGAAATIDSTTTFFGVHDYDTGIRTLAIGDAVANSTTEGHHASYNYVNGAYVVDTEDSVDFDIVNTTTTGATIAYGGTTQAVVFSDAKAVTSVDGITTTGLNQVTATWTVTAQTETVATSIDWWNADYTTWDQSLNSGSGGQVAITTLIGLRDAFMSPNWGGVVWINEDTRVDLVGTAGATSGTLISQVWDGTYNSYTDQNGQLHTSQHYVDGAAIAGGWAIETISGVEYLTVNVPNQGTTAFRVANGVLKQTEIMAVDTSYSETLFYGVDLATFQNMHIATIPPVINTNPVDTLIIDSTLIATETAITAFPAGTTFTDGYVTMVFSSTTAGTITEPGNIVHNLTLANGVASATVDGTTYSYKMLSGNSDMIVLGQIDTNLTAEMNVEVSGPPPVWTLVSTSATVDPFPSSGIMTLWTTDTDNFEGIHGESAVKTVFNFTNHTAQDYFIDGTASAAQTFTVNANTMHIVNGARTSDIQLMGGFNGFYAFEENYSGSYTWGANSAGGSADISAYLTAHSDILWSESGQDYNNNGTAYDYGIVTRANGAVNGFTHYDSNLANHSDKVVDHTATATLSTNSLVIDEGDRISTYSIANNEMNVTQTGTEVFSLSETNPFGYTYAYEVNNGNGTVGIGLHDGMNLTVANLGGTYNNTVAPGYALAGIDSATDTAANTIVITAADVLAMGASNGAGGFIVGVNRGANDTLDLSGWTDTNTDTTVNGVVYDIYRNDTSTTAFLATHVV